MTSYIIIMMPYVVIMMSWHTDIILHILDNNPWYYVNLIIGAHYFPLIESCYYYAEPKKYGL